jgi:hypothetical protein
LIGQLSGTTEEQDITVNVLDLETPQTVFRGVQRQRLEKLLPHCPACFEIGWCPNYKRDCIANENSAARQSVQAVPDL